MYERVLKPSGASNGRGLSLIQGQIVVFIASAIWHGFSPGYYFFFCWVFCMNFISHWVTRRITHKVPNNLNWLYSLLCWFASHLMMDYGALYFTLPYQTAHLAMAHLNWLGHWICGLLFLVAFLDSPRPSGRTHHAKRT